MSLPPSQIEQAVRDDKTYYKLKGDSSVRAVSWDEDISRLRELLQTHIGDDPHKSPLIKKILNIQYNTETKEFIHMYMYTSNIIPASELRKLKTSATNSTGIDVEEILTEYKIIIQRLIDFIKTKIDNILRIEISLFRFLESKHSSPIWHKNYFDENIFRCNCYIETGTKNYVDLIFNNKTKKSQENFNYTNNKRINSTNSHKYLKLNTNTNNTVLWNDDFLYHRTPKNLTNVDYPRSFIGFDIVTTNNSIKTQNALNFKNLTSPQVVKGNITNNNNAGGGIDLITNISNTLTKIKLNKIAKNLKIKNFKNKTKQKLIKEIIKNI